MAGFSLHPNLAADCHVLGALELSQVLLHRNSLIPWLILVPEVEVTEVCDLSARERTALNAEIDTLSACLRDNFPVTKLNVAAIGNLVPQLHVHVIGRHENDPCWPGVVWGNLPDGPEWPEAKVRELKRYL
jgi:diadenosine tetraphosphate (Ap4A) HIT family hydrolase